VYAALSLKERDLLRCSRPNHAQSSCYPWKVPPDTTLTFSLLIRRSDAGSRLNLAEATHVLMFDTFLSDNEGSDLANEKQCIARAYRSGLDHPLEIVRFIAQVTIEEVVLFERHPELAARAQVDKLPNGLPAA
jgi:hypothetical protein